MKRKSTVFLRDRGAGADIFRRHLLGLTPDGSRKEVGGQ